MSFLFARSKPKTLPEVVFALNEWAQRLDTKRHPAEQTDASQRRQAAEEVARLLVHIRRVWGPENAIEDPITPGPSGSGADDGRVEPDQITALAKEVYATNVLSSLLTALPALEFDSRRDTASLFGFLLRRPPTVEYLLHKAPHIFDQLIRLAGNSEVHRTAGHILRACAKHEPLVAYIMDLQRFWRFFQYIDDVEFEVATDNFSTFQEFLRSFPDLTSRFLVRHADYFTQCMNGLMRSPNYVAKRQSLRLQFHLVRQQRNHEYMIYYMDNLDNLKLVMRLMRDRSKNIHYEAFQLFKIFVANPNKPRAIVDVLTRNKTKLLEVLDALQGGGDRKDDEVFKDERQFCMRKIAQLPDLQPRSPQRTSPPNLSPQRSPQRATSPSRGQGVQAANAGPQRPVSPSRAQVPPQYGQQGPPTPVMGTPILGTPVLGTPVLGTPLQAHGTSQLATPGPPGPQQLPGQLPGPPTGPGPFVGPIPAGSPGPSGHQGLGTPIQSGLRQPGHSQQSQQLQQPQIQQPQQPQQSQQSHQHSHPPPNYGQAPSILNLGQAPPVLSQQRIPDFGPH